MPSVENCQWTSNKQLEDKSNYIQKEKIYLYGTPIRQWLLIRMIKVCKLF